MTRKRWFLALGGVYLAVLILLVALYGFHRKNNPENFAPASEFTLETWVKLPLGLDINRAVLYLLMAGFLTVFTMLWVARRMQAHPNRVQTAIETIYVFLRDTVTRGAMDERMARKWFPFVATLFLFIWFSNLIGYIPLPTSHETFNVFGAKIPSFAIYAATANISIPLILALVVWLSFIFEGVRVKGPVGYLKGLIPAGIHGPAAVPMFILELLSTFMRLISLSVRLFANILAGHLIILFMAGGLAVLLSLEALGWLTMPLGVALFLFEVGLVATLQAFIFATLTAIYLGGSVSEEH